MPKNFSVKSNNLSLHQIPCSFRVLCASHWLYREFCCQSAWSFRRFQMDSGILLLQGVCHHTGNRWDNGSTSVESGHRPCPYRRENPLKIWGKNILQIIWNRMSTMHRLILVIIEAFFQNAPRSVFITVYQKNASKSENVLVWSESNLRSVGCHALMIALRDAWKKGFREIQCKVSLIITHCFLLLFLCCILRY